MPAVAEASCSCREFAAMVETAAALVWADDAAACGTFVGSTGLPIAAPDIFARFTPDGPV